VKIPFEDYMRTEATIECDKCHKEEGRDTEEWLSDVLSEQGWTVTRSGRVLCPECRPKRRKP
jgi:hypothetical protein